MNNSESEARRDTLRARAAVMAILDGRNPDDEAERASIMVSLEHALATLLLLLYKNPPVAARMLNEGLVPGTEERISLFQSITASSGTRK